MATVESVAAWIARALQPLVYASQSDDDLVEFVARLGWTLPTAPPSLRALQDGLARVYESLAEVDAVRLRVDAGEAPPSELESILHTLALDVLLVASDLHALEGRLREELPADYVAVTGIDKEFQRRLFDWLLSTDLARESAVGYRLLRVLGVVEVTQEPEDPAHHQPSFLRYRIGWDRLLALLRDPAAVAREVYGWGTPAIDGDRLFAELVPLSFALGVPAELRYPAPELTPTVAPGAEEPATGPAPQLWIPVVRTDDLALLIAVFVVPTTSPTQNQGLAITLVPSGALDEEVPLGDGLGLRVEAAAQIGTGTALVLGPGRDPRVILDLGGAATALTSGRVAAWVVRHPPTWDGKAGVAEPGGTGIQAAAYSFGIGAEAAGGTDVEVFAELRIDQGRVTVVPPGDDGLLSEVLPAEGIAAPFSLAVRWSRQGLRFVGASGLATTLPLQLSAGPLRLREMRIGIAAGSDALEAEASLTAAVTLGPLVLTLERLGLLLEGRAQPGNVGPFDLRTAFKPPSGAEVTIETSAVTGGGFLFFDPRKRQYAGALQLECSGIALKAVGLLTTRLPGGASGFSLLVIVSAEFTPMQLGLGFTLTGVGGLLGINRVVAVEPLRAGLKSGTLAAILFPADPVSHAQQLVATLSTVFPPAAGRHVFGPMARIEWGTPTLITIDICLVLELPAPVRLIVLGRLRAVLPDEDAAVVRLQMDLLGVIDFDRRQAAVDATLVDSRLGSFPLTGAMAMRLSWDASPAFLLAVGGFNPRFLPPPGFPRLDRIAVALATGDQPRLRLEAYLALTSNTVQFGARLELSVAAGPFTVAGFLSFDALVQPRPLSLVVDIAGALAVTAGGHPILSVTLQLALSGPAPWRARGRASFSILLFDVSVGFDVTIGRAPPATLPETVQVAPLLLAALGDVRSWSAQLPVGGEALVTLRALAPARQVLAHPLALLQVRQRLVPLERTLDRFGSDVPAGARLFRIAGATLGGTAAPTEPLEDLFAPAQFSALSDDQKLSQPSFVPMRSGVRVGEHDVAHGTPLSVQVVFEQMLVPTPGGTA